MIASALRLPSMRHEEERIFLEAMRCLNLVGLGMHAGEMAGNLPFGQQRLAAIARALATEPRLLLMDEPAAGLEYAGAVGAGGFDPPHPGDGDHRAAGGA